MKKLVASIILLAVLIQGCKILKQQQFKPVEWTEKVMLKKEGQEEFFYWELKDENILWGFELDEIRGLNKYKDSLVLELGNEKLESALEKETTQNLKKSLIEKEVDRDRINALLVHTGSIGRIRKINYLESEILNYQINRFPMFSHPTEFHGFIMKNEKEGKIRVYFASSDTEWPPKPGVIIDELEKEINRGWKLIGHLHNHFCKKDKDYVGILAPSLADAQYYKWLKADFKLEKALITNGFHTVEIESKDFEKFESH